MWKVLSLVAPFFFACCFPYVYHDRQRVLLEQIDIDSTFEIAEIELEEGGFDATLTIWAIRDQIVTVEQAKLISAIYFKYIDRIAAQSDKTTADFGVWHFTWAISNLYRNGDSLIQAELEDAYQDAKKRPETLATFKDIAIEHVNGSELYMGDIHDIARSYAYSHVVVPGNDKYLQSLDQYTKSREKK